MIIYDCEIEKGIKKNDHDNTVNPEFADIKYCDGWRDFDGMGLTVVCAYDYTFDRYRVFMEDNLDELEALIANTDLMVGFNSIAFDNNLLRANGIEVDDGKCYDLLRAVWEAAGLGPEFRYPSHAGYGLDDICKTNFGINKTGHGAMAPVQWQRGRYGAVVDYCLNDVRLTKRVLDFIFQNGHIVSPKTQEILQVRRPK